MLNFVSVDTVLRKQSQILEKLMKFSHEEHGQMDKGRRVACMPTIKILILDELYQFLGKLIEERFS